MSEEQKPVAWVDVKNGDEGPYEFHGIEKLPVGRHHLFLAAQPAPPLMDYWRDLAKDAMRRLDAIEKAQPEPAQRLSEERIREILTPVFMRQDQASIHWPDIFEEVRAIEAAIVPPGYVVVKNEPVARVESRSLTILREQEMTWAAAWNREVGKEPVPVYAAAKDTP